jgi:hypothetical protein
MASKRRRELAFVPEQAISANRPVRSPRAAQTVRKTARRQPQCPAPPAPRPRRSGRLRRCRMSSLGRPTFWVWLAASVKNVAEVVAGKAKTRRLSHTRVSQSRISIWTVSHRPKPERLGHAKGGGIAPSAFETDACGRRCSLEVLIAAEWGWDVLGGVLCPGEASTHDSQYRLQELIATTLLTSDSLSGGKPPASFGPHRLRPFWLFAEINPTSHPLCRSLPPVPYVS